MSEHSQAVQNATISETLFAQLRATPIFSSLKDEELRCLHGLEEIYLEKGDVLVKQGEIAHYFWVLLEGELTVSQTTPEGKEMVMISIPSGNAFGELPLLANIPNAVNLTAEDHCHLVQFSEDSFWSLMTTCPDVRQAILANMAKRFQKMQSTTLQQEKMASLGTLAAGLMHELNNPGAAARRAASQLRSNLMRMHELSAKFSKAELNREQKECLHELQEHTLSAKQPIVMNSLEQSDAEEKLAEWMEESNIENAWKMAPTLVSVGMKAEDLQCARQEFPGTILSDALNWIEAMASSMQLVGAIEESIGRVTDLVMAVKSYAYEGKGLKQSVDVNNSIHATLLILGHKMREKEIVVEKDFSPLPPLQSECTGLNQIWTNLLDNSIDAVGQRGKISVKTWAEPSPSNPERTDICIRLTDNGSGIPLESQPHIFDTFFTTKPLGVGTGLGLGIVHRIVEQYGGTIHFTSEPGDTEFVVRLPSAPK
ncbi:ATP-binding protein [Edaphobacter flagellatus]|uniref:ATP-binding protein n=1 Tax=Edaphobacter flagellatus TaxID=1933044 RepID=UPI0021B347DC|nr:ATP-binding protein [Edaphobacter flagellatus]